MKTRTAICIVIYVLIAISGAQAQNLLDGPESIAFDSLHNRYIVSCWGNRNLVAMDDLGNQTLLLTFGNRPLGNHIDGNTLYVSRGFSPATVSIFDLETDAVIADILISNSEQLDGLTTDTSGYLYVVDSDFNRLYRIDRATYAYEIFLDSGLPGRCQDVHFDEVNNRLLIAGYDDDSPIVAVSLPDGVATELVPDAPGGFDGVTTDNEGTIYCSVYLLGFVYAWDNDGSNQRIASWGHQGAPSGLDYNRIDEILAVPCFNADRIDLVPFADDDNDDIPYFRDNCPETHNPEQADADLDGEGDDCDLCTDSDGDGYGDPGFVLNTCEPDNCPETPNSGQYDMDSDGVGDECDNCLLAYNPGQEDADQNDIGDACEGCCLGRVGDANNIGGDEPTIGDVSAIIDAKFITGICDGILECLTESDINQSGGIDPTCDDITVGDISTLIDYLFITGASLGLPPCL